MHRPGMTPATMPTTDVYVKTGGRNGIHSTGPQVMGGMHPRQSTSGGSTVGGRCGQVSMPADLTRCGQTTCNRSTPKENHPSPPKFLIRILSYHLLDFFHPLSPVCRSPAIFRTTRVSSFYQYAWGFQLGPRVSQWRRCLICCAAAR